MTARFRAEGCANSGKGTGEWFVRDDNPELSDTKYFRAVPVLFLSKAQAQICADMLNKAYEDHLAWLEQKHIQEKADDDYAREFFGFPPNE